MLTRTSGNVLRKPLIFIANLISKFSGVAENEHRDFAVDRIELLKRRQHEHCSLSVTRLRLAKYIHAKYLLEECTLVELKSIKVSTKQLFLTIGLALTLRRVFEAKVADRAKELWL